MIDSFFHISPNLTEKSIIRYLNISPKRFIEKRKKRKEFSNNWIIHTIISFDTKQGGYK